MVIASNLGFPRIGRWRELKRAVEGFWQGQLEPEALHAAAKDLRCRHWRLQHEAGIEHIPSGDFSLYDHVLDTAVMVGAVPQRFRSLGNGTDLSTYFAMARGTQEIAPLDMTKWFDTNYHYLVPEFEPDITFSLASTAPSRRVRRSPVAGNPHTAGTGRPRIVPAAGQEQVGRPHAARAARPTRPRL